MKINSLEKWLDDNRLGALVEIFIIIIFALWVGKTYLDTSYFMWPNGTGMGVKLTGHYFWENLSQCGACALWNGNINGGRPALADLFGSQFHPLVALTTLIWGVVGGAKIAWVLMFALAGIAQWWMAKALKLGASARMWSALLATAGGHFATKNNEGNFGLILSTVACSLAISAVLDLCINPTRRKTIILALMGTGALLAGQGYMQLALVSIAPALLFFIINSEKGILTAKEIGLAVLISILLIGFVLVPTISFFPNFTKDNADPLFGFAQPFQYIPLNLVINDMNFFISGNILGRQPYNDLVYIGWIPVLLAIYMLRISKKEDVRVIGFLLVSTFMIVFFASATPLRYLAKWFPFFLGFRFPSNMSSLMAPPIIAMAALGADRLLKSKMPGFNLAFSGESEKSTTLRIETKWILILLLLISINSVAKFSKSFLYLRDMNQPYQELAKTKIDGAQWVSLINSDFVEPALSLNLKVTNLTYSGALWSGRTIPAPYVAFEQGGLVTPANTYAYINSASGIIPCKAQATGGDINVSCDSTSGGTLVINENNVNGWKASIDSKPASLVTGNLLSVKIPAGQHMIDFRYRPFNATLGGILSIIGLLLAGYLFIKKS